MRAREFAVRDGSNGSQVNGLAVLPATVKTADGKPLNPTGAGNAYSGAYAAVVCENENLPSWMDMSRIVLSKQPLKYRQSLAHDVCSKIIALVV